MVQSVEILLDPPLGGSASRARKVFLATPAIFIHDRQNLSKMPTWALFFWTLVQNQAENTFKPPRRSTPEVGFPARNSPGVGGIWLVACSGVLVLAKWLASGQDPPDP